MTALFTAIILGMGEAIKLAGRLLEGVSRGDDVICRHGRGRVAAMAVAVALGVWISVRIGMGQATRGEERPSSPGGL